MPAKLSRRKALAMGATALTAGALSAKTARAVPEYGPDPDLVRDLTPGNTPIRISRGFSVLEGKSITESVIAMKKRGYTGYATGHDYWLAMKDSEIRELHQALKDNDCVFFEVVAYRNMIHPNLAERQKALSYLARCLEAADRIGCPMVGTCTGSLAEGTYIGMHPENWSPKTWKITVDSVKQVLKDTAGMKAALGIEAQITTNIGRPEDHKRLMDDVGDKRCAVNLDPVNMMSIETYYHSTELIEECFDLLGEQILGCHAKDSWIEPDVQTIIHREVCAGRGVMDYETYLVRLSRMDWPRSIHPEHVPPEQLIEAADYIRAVAKKVGVNVIG